MTLSVAILISGSWNLRSGVALRSQLPLILLYISILTVILLRIPAKAMLKYQPFFADGCLNFKQMCKNI